MAASRCFIPNILSAFWVAVMIFLWVTFAPTQAGGLASYIIVIGNSMEPNFHIGDLVVAHEKPDYRVGDAVVYKNNELERFVFHRIISYDRGRYTLQGDNNSWKDTYRPTSDEIIGKLWIRIPQAGRYIQMMRNPVLLSMITGIFGGTLLLNLMKGKSKGYKRMEKKSIQEWFSSMGSKIQGWLTRANDQEHPHPNRSMDSSVLEGIFFSHGLIAVLSLILAIISFSRPTTRLESNEIDYNHLGIFSYSAPAPTGIYDTDRLDSRDPIFPSLTCVVDFNFQYVFMAEKEAGITGTHQLTAVISEPNSGWQRRIPMQSVIHFEGNSFGTGAHLDLCQIESIIDTMENGTDFHSAYYFLAIMPNIHVQGDIAGHPIDGSFNPGTTFRYDRVHFSLINPKENMDPLQFSEPGFLHEDRTVVNTISLMGMKLEIPALRWISLIGLFISLTGMAVLLWKLQFLSRNYTDEFIRQRYQSLMIEIQSPGLIDSTNPIDVVSIDDLVKLAEKYNSPILHKLDASFHRYYVKGAEGAFRFVMKLKANQSISSEASSNVTLWGRDHD